MSSRQPLSTIILEDMLREGLDAYSIVDARSPSEYAEDHIPGAVNIPLLDDHQRHLTGICYKQEGPKAAKRLAVELVSGELPAFINRFAEVEARGKPIVVYCWRGGLRSFTSQTLVHLAGIRTIRLDRGYKGFRGHVFRFFEEFDPDYRFITVFGPTGCAKSEMLRSLDAKGFPVIDLEKHAAHKGSSFGHVDEVRYAGMTQKLFESHLWHDFYRHADTRLFFIEGESKKIGKVAVPHHLFTRYHDAAAVSVVVESPMDFRVRFTIDNYKPDAYPEEIRGSLSRIKRYVGGERFAELNRLLDANDYETFTRYMLEDYYDPLYRHSFPERVDHTVEAASVDDGVRALENIYAAHAR